MSEVWILGKCIHTSTLGIVWSFEGAFDSEKNAVKECIDVNYFIGPAVINAILPSEIIEWPGCYYPLLNTENLSKLD